MSMSDRACLVTLEIKSPGFRKTSKEGSACLATEYRAENDRIAASVALLPRQCLAKITKLASAARKLVEGSSAPWQGKARIMPIHAMTKLRADYDNIAGQYTVAVAELLADYDELCRKSQPAIGRFASEFTMPPRDKVASKLSMSLNFLPLPGGRSDWRVAMAEEEIAIVTDGIKAANDEMARANRERAQEALNDMLERVSAYKIVQDDTTKTGERIEGAFHQSALDQLKQTAEMLKSLNFLGDVEFGDICDEMERIGRMKAAELKSSQAFRDSVLADAAKLSERLDG